MSNGDLIPNNGGSLPFSFIFGAEDWKKIGRSLVIALAGALVAWLSTYFIPSLANDKSFQAMVLTAACGWIVNTLKIWISDTTK